MSGKKALVGLSLLCVLVFSAFGAANASAAIHTTAFTCAPTGTGFSDAHCDTPSVSGTFSHVAIAANTSTEVVGSNNKTASETSSWILKSKIATVPIEITCASVKAMGSLENNTTSGGIKGEGTVETFGKATEPTGPDCTLIKPEPAMEKCSVTVENLPNKSVSENMGIKFSPKTGTLFANIKISKSGTENCSVASAEPYKVEGTAFAHGLEGGTNGGATLHFTPAETAKTLTFGVQPAELSGDLTLRMGPTESPGNPIATTTVE